MALRTDTNRSGAGEPVVLGRVAGLYGVRGWVRVLSWTEPREALLEYGDCLLRQGAGWTESRLEEGRRHGKSVVAKFAGIDDRDTAAGLVGVDIAVPREQLPETPEGQYYWAELEGLEVRHTDGRLLGRVAYMLATGANDVMAVQGTSDREGDGNREILIPFVKDRYVLGVDLDKGVIDVDWEWD